MVFDCAAPPSFDPASHTYLYSEKGEMLLRGVGALRCLLPPSASVQWQPDGLTMHTRKWFLGAGFLGAPPTSLRYPTDRATTASMLPELQPRAVPSEPAPAEITDGIGAPDPSPNNLAS